jgi:MoaD family protein
VTVASVKVRLFHELRNAAGQGEIAITASNLGELFRNLVDRYGKSARDVLFDSGGNIREYAFIYVNKTLQKPLDMSVPLKDGDIILIIPPVSGGSRIPRFEVYVPENLDDALNYLAENPADTLPIAGGTDLLPRIRRKKVSVKRLLDLSGLTQLRYISRDEGDIKIGALTTIADFGERNDNSAWSIVLDQVAKKFGSPNIRSVATVGGNICSASSSEDLIPVFLTLDARVKTIRKSGARDLTLRDFLIAKRKTALNGDEILAEVSFLETDGRSVCSFQKLGLRNILIISVVSVAAFLEVDPASSKIMSARIALNRLKGKIPERAESVEKELLERKLDERTIDAAVDVLGRELALTSDSRASADYRREAAKVLLRRALLECRETIFKK